MSEQELPAAPQRRTGLLLGLSIALMAAVMIIAAIVGRFGYDHYLRQQGFVLECASDHPDQCQYCRPLQGAETVRYCQAR